MKRRQFISLVGGSAVLPLEAWAQLAPNHPLVGVLSPLSSATAARNIEALRAGLRDFGYVEGRNITIELRFAEGAIERLPDLAKELVGLKPTVIVAGSPPAALAVRAQTPSIPIIINSTADPVALGLASSIARPGGNVTGFWWGAEILIGKRLELLKEAVPDMIRVGIFVNPNDATNLDDLKSLPEAAAGLGLGTRVIEVRNPGDFQFAFATAAHEGLQGLSISLAPLFIDNRTELTALATSTRLPVIYGFREFPAVCGLMSYGTSLEDLHRRKAGMVNKILTGASPADLPIERPTRFELVINLKAAGALGLNISPALLARADEVIE
jgi:putative ABC transport system substrate-binding protein